MVSVKSPEQIAIMRKANLIVAEVLAELRAAVRPGISTGELDRMAEDGTRSRGAKPAFKGYGAQFASQAFPRSVCVSINDEVVHGIPSDRRVLRDGDLVGLDFGVCFEGFYGDSAITVPIGEVDDEAKRLMQVTEAALWAGIGEMQVGKRIGDVSSAIQKHVECHGFSVVRQFVGHGIGRSLHEDPQVPNYGKPDRGERLREGLVLALEPMVNAGTHEVVIKKDGWTAVTRDGRRSAHFEHSVAVTADGPYVLSQLPADR